MREILPGVFIVASNDNKGFGWQHFVVRPSGNFVIDAGRLGSLSDSYADFEARGGVKAILTGDRHFAGTKTDQLRVRFGATVYVTAIEGEAIARRGAADVLMTLERQTIEGDVEVIPTPGHTPGQVSFLFPVGGACCLFTGDFVYRREGAWRPGSLSRKRMRGAFENLRGLKFDYVVPWTDYEEQELFIETGGREEAVIDEMIAALTKP